MRTWRVGTFSMGAALIILGVTLIAGQLFDENIFRYIKLWMPIILIIIGSEILIYLFLHKKESSFIKYDFISIIFIGVVGCFGIVFTILMSTGLISELEKVVYAKEITEDLPSYEQPLSKEIKKVVLVSSSGHNLSVQKSSESSIHVFGTYSHTLYGDETEEQSDGKDISKTKLIGDTLYVRIKSLPQERGVFRNGGYFNVTIVVPEQVMVTNEYDEVL